MLHMNKVFFTLVFFLISLSVQLNAQSPAAVGKDTSLKSYQKASQFLTNKVGKPFMNLTRQMTKSLGNVKLDLSKEDIYLFGGMNFAKQNIRSGGFNSPFVYAVEQNNVFKPGFMGGARIERKYRSKYPYAISVALNRYSTGTNYKEINTLAPFNGGFSNFKAEGQLFNLSFSALYKQAIPILDSSKYKFYFLAGPSIDARLSGQSIDNQVGNNYKKLNLRAHIGLEFDNNSYYTLFLHYRHGIGSFTKSPIKTSLNNFEMGMMVKASDFF